MIDRNDVTFVIPIFNLVDARLNNLKFILPYILSTGCEVLVVEQVSTNNSLLTDMLSSLVAEQYAKNFKHLLYLHDNKLIHKSGIINWATKNHVDTKYVWVNDADFYMKYNDVFHTLWNAAFIQPYQIAKKLNKENSDELLHGKKLNIDFSDEESMYISLYGALSFIFEKSAFLDMGGMNENLFGWGKEDEELSNRLKDCDKQTQTLELKGIHLWHPVNDNTISYELNLRKDVLDVAVVTCHYNWVEFTAPKRNLHGFIRRMKIDKIPLFGIELSLSDKFETTGIDGWKQIKVSKDNIFFQKEACINLAVKELVPKKYKKIAWIDADLYFVNKNWYNETSKKLNDYKVIQLYSHGIETDRCGRQTSKLPSAMFTYENIPIKQRTEWINNVRDIGYPGGAWAARRELWQHGGLYPYRVIGSGDTAFFLAVLNPKNGWMENELFVERYNFWKKGIREYVGDSISHIDGCFIHEWHGDKVDRKYTGRYSILKNLNVRNIELNDIGLVHNHGDRTINENMLKYFNDRNEDGVIKETECRKVDAVVYTCIVGNYDNLREVVEPEKYIDYICYTDANIESKTWKIKPIPSFLRLLAPEKIARCIKILPHLFLQEYQTSLWVDGSIQILGNIRDFINNNLKNYFAIPKHPHRTCVYEEGKTVILLKKDSDEMVNSQLNFYRKKNYPQNYGMVQSGIIARNHNDKRCIAISNLWWNEVREFSKRDQLSFNYCVWKKNVTIDILNPNIIVGKNFQIWTHVHKGNEKVTLKQGYGDMKNYINGEEV